MAIELGNSLEVADLYTGKANVRVLAINPTLQECIDLKLPVKKDAEPVYVSKGDDGTDKMMLKIWVEEPEVKVLTPVTFFLEDKFQVSSGGKNRYINDFGANSYAETIEEALAREYNGNKFFKSDGARQAKVGECELIDFLKALFCTPQDKKVTIDNISKIIKGDVSELKGYMKLLPKDRMVQILLHVKSTDKGDFQAVYTKYFERGGSKTNTYWEKHFSKQDTNINYQGSFLLKKFEKVTPDSEPTEGKQFDMFA